MNTTAIIIIAAVGLLIAANSLPAACARCRWATDGGVLRQSTSRAGLLGRLMATQCAAAA